MSKNNPMKAQEQRERMSKNNPMFNSEIVEKVAKQIRKAINKKGIRVDEAVPIEQYAAKIESIPFYDPDNEQTSGFANFVTSYFNNMSNIYILDKN